MNKFDIYKASAGSGKTYILTKEYIKISLSNEEEFRHTLAITFTNKAAEEMKTRIIKYLRELSEGINPSYEQELIEEGVKGDIKSGAGKLLEKILHNYSDFAVMTIDSFFHMIIRSFSRELKLNIGYNVETDTDSVIKMIIDGLLDDAETDSKLRAYLEEYIFYNIEESKGWRIEKKISEIAKELFKEKFWEYKVEGDYGSTDNTREAINELFNIVGNYETLMKDFSQRISDFLKSNDLTVSDFPYGAKGYINWYLNKICGMPTKRVHSSIVSIEDSLSQSSPLKVRHALEKGLYDLMKSAYDHWSRNGRVYFTAKELLKTVYVIGIFRALIDKLKSWRDDNKTILISDASIIIRQIISHETVPFIYEKAGNRYRNFLIDEFQDTSTFQWKNLLPLIINALAEGTNSMIVGDVKQSIYRWRNGNMSLLLYEVSEDLKKQGDFIREYPLNYNRRSLKNIVEFNNRFFGSLHNITVNESGLPNDFTSVISDAYHDLLQNTENCREGGYVNVCFTKNEENMSSYETAGKKLIEHVNSVIWDGYRYKDILVLVRKNSDGNKAAALLTEAGYKVVSSDSLLLLNSAKVKLIINLFKYMIDNNDRLAKTEILYNWLVKIKEDKIHTDKLFSPDIDKILADCLPDGFFRNNAINPDFYNYGVYELTEKFISLFGLNTSRDAFILRLLDIVFDFSVKYGSDIGAFLKWWEDKKESYSIVLPQTEDAIRIMTIHKSKGLESRVVIIPFASWQTRNDGYIWVSSDVAPFSQLGPCLVRTSDSLKGTLFENEYLREYTLNKLDNMNLLYVAFTRAAERLYAIVPENDYSKHIRTALAESFGLNENEYEFELGRKEKINDKPYEPVIKAGQGFYSRVPENKIRFKSSGRNYGLWEENEKIKKGLTIHRLLSQVISVDDIEHVLSRAVDAGYITEESYDFYYNELKQIIAMDEVKEIYLGGSRVINEREILTPDGEVLIPDRIVIKDDCTFVIDYKTGEEDHGHVEQILRYSAALEQCGFRNIRKFLFYTDKRKVVEVN
jgi:ATP-dependent helicase/nuclease subunit A